MKSLSITLIVIFIAFFSISVLSRYTSVDSLEQYDKLYEKYVSENYQNSEYHQKLAKAKESVEYLKTFMGSTVDIPNDKSPFWKHLITLPSNPPEFNILKHYHIVLVFCGRFADLLQGDKSMPTVTFNDLQTKLKKYGSIFNDWDTIETILFKAKFETHFNDPMFEYAEKFLNSPNGISRKEQTIRTEHMILGHESVRLQNTVNMCSIAISVYREMMPKEDIRPPVRYGSFEKWKRYLKIF
ncbi:MULTISPECIES: hypothetical protein [unclassified Bartonella]|uniref:hypothetical protein n=1 Tax=unclassified Bartonella TaxID=2645622 RepID=UPI0035D02FB7